MQYGTTLVSCDTTINNITNSMLKEFPTLKEKSVCSLNCKPTSNSLKFTIYLSYQTVDGKIKNLQTFLDSRLQSGESTCGHMESGIFCKGIKKNITEISDMHLFIDVFYWEGNKG